MPSHPTRSGAPIKWEPEEIKASVYCRDRTFLKVYVHRRSVKNFFIELSFNCVFSCFCRQKKEKAPKEKRPFVFIPRMVDTNAANPPRAAFLQILSQQNLQNVGFILWCGFVVVGTFRSR